MNRGLARRTVFENREDIRFFLSRLAYAVRRKQIEVHAYSVLTTHFHLLVRSPNGELAEAMRWIQNHYVRWFNRKRKRDGPLFRGRFQSRTITSETYWRTVVRYIDHNPVGAGLTRNAGEYRWGSAWHYARPRGPIWLARHEVEARVCAAACLTAYDCQAYAAAWGTAPSPGTQWVVDKRIAASAQAPDELDLLVRASRFEVRKWMEAKARVADGEFVGHIFADPQTVLAKVAVESDIDPDWTVCWGSRNHPGWPILAAGLLQLASGSTTREIQLRLQASASTVARNLARHRHLCLTDPEYRQRAADVLIAALGAAFSMGSCARSAAVESTPSASARAPNTAAQPCLGPETTPKW
jgi:REP element-mobilizing transposase RayT